MDHTPFKVEEGKGVHLADLDTAYTGEFKSKSEAKEKLKDDIDELSDLQEVLYASDKYALLLIFQAMDAAGKDSTIEHVMSGVNPQGCQVFSFKSPSAEELDHDYLWRCMKSLPERGRIGIFNRSYYEEVLVVRVHPEYLSRQKLPKKMIDDGIWQRRFEEIKNFEKYLVDNGVVILKFFLHVSADEQKQRFLKRINRPEKNWKFSMNDVKERAFWNDYQRAYEDAVNNTSTSYAPWYVIPADHKWFMRAAVSDIIISKLKELDLKFPKVSKKHKEELLKAKEMLENEKSL